MILRMQSMKLKSTNNNWISGPRKMNLPDNSPESKTYGAFWSEEFYEKERQFSSKEDL